MLATVQQLSVKATLATEKWTQIPPKTRTTKTCGPEHDGDTRVWRKGGAVVHTRGIRKLVGPKRMTM